MKFTYIKGVLYCFWRIAQVHHWHYREIHLRRENAGNQKTLPVGTLVCAIAPESRYAPATPFNLPRRSYCLSDK